MLFKQLKSELDQISQVAHFSLTVVNSITYVGILCFEQIQNRKNLSVIWHKSFTDSIRASNQLLQDFQSNCNYFWISCIQGSLDRNNKLWYNRQNLSTSFFQHIKYTLYCDEPVWVTFLSDSFKENRKIMVVVELLDMNFPVNFVLGTMFNRDWQITSVIEQSELTNWNYSSINRTSPRFHYQWLWFWLI